MARGDGGKAVFEEDKDRFDFLDHLGRVGGSHGWRIHAWVLMGNRSPCGDCLRIMKNFHDSWRLENERQPPKCGFSSIP
jgi:hypothetical protein